MKLLIVDDEKRIRELIVKYALFEGYECGEAENGMQAVEIERAQTFDLIIMDVNMPVMDGLTATRIIRDGVGNNAETPIVVLSASARTEDHEAGLNAGADAYLNKPIDFSALAALMGRVGGGREAVAQMAQAPSQASVAA